MLALPQFLSHRQQEVLHYGSCGSGANTDCIIRWSSSCMNLQRIQLNAAGLHLACSLYSVHHTAVAEQHSSDFFFCETKTELVYQCLNFSIGSQISGWQWILLSIHFRSEAAWLAVCYTDKNWTICRLKNEYSTVQNLIAATSDSRVATGTLQPSSSKSQDALAVQAVGRANSEMTQIYMCI